MNRHYLLVFCTLLIGTPTVQCATSSASRLIPDTSTHKFNLVSHNHVVGVFSNGKATLFPRYNGHHCEKLDQCKKKCTTARCIKYTALLATAALVAGTFKQIKTSRPVQVAILAAIGLDIAACYYERQRKKMYSTEYGFHQPASLFDASQGSTLKIVTYYTGPQDLPLAGVQIAIIEGLIEKYAPEGHKSAIYEGTHAEFNQKVISYCEMSDDDLVKQIQKDPDLASIMVKKITQDSHLAEQIMFSKALSEWYYSSLITITPDPGNGNCFVITPKEKSPFDPLKSCMGDLHLQSPMGRAIVTSLYNACMRLSTDHNNADFNLHITSKEGNLIVKVTLFESAAQSSEAAATPSITDCVFCDPSKRTGKTLAENNTTIAFEKNNPPRSPIDFLIIPKQHIINYKDPACTADVFIQQLEMAQQLAGQLTDPSDVQLRVSNGSAAGQGVFHAHMHFKSYAQWKPSPTV